MNKLSAFCDRLMYGALLGLIFFLPYSLMLISVFQGLVVLAWLGRRVSLFQASRRQGVAAMFHWKAGNMVWPLTAIGLLILLTVPVSHYPLISLKKLCTRFLCQILLMCAVAEVLHSRKRLYGLLAVLVLMAVGVGFYAICQYVRADNLVHGRVWGPMHHPNDLGTLLVTLLPVVLALMVALSRKSSSLAQASSCKTWAIPVLVVSFVLMVTVLGLTGSRGAWLAFALSMVAFVVCLKRWKAAVLMVFMLAVFFWLSGMYCLKMRLDIYNVYISHQPVMKPSWSNPWGLPVEYNAWELFSNPSGRPAYWETAMEVIKHSPWFGCGYSAYMKTLSDLGIGNIEYPHNSLLHITAELGILGLLFYLWLFAALCRQGWRLLREVSQERDLYVLGYGAFLGIMAWMMHSLLDTPWSSLQLSVLLWVMIGFLLGLEGAGKWAAGKGAEEQNGFTFERCSHCQK